MNTVTEHNSPAMLPMNSVVHNPNAAMELYTIDKINEELTEARKRLSLCEENCAELNAALYNSSKLNDEQTKKIQQLESQLEECKARAIEHAHAQATWDSVNRDLQDTITQKHAISLQLAHQTQRLHELQALFMRMSAQVLTALEAAQEKEYEQSLQKEL